jgi:hypothetical protein
MPEAIDGQGTTFQFGGQYVGGVVGYEFFDGEIKDPVHRPLSGSPVALPPVPDFGQCLLKLYSNPADSGQILMQSSLTDRLVVDCVLTYKDGTTRNFKAYCRKLPVTGSKDNTNPVMISNALLRISGSIT